MRRLRQALCRQLGATAQAVQVQAGRRIQDALPELVGFLLRCNDVPDGTVLLTGTGIIIPHEAALAEGDVVEISCAEIGMLRNPCRVVGTSTPAGAAG